MTVTIRDVARQAGTSTATVSHVLNDTGRITRETRQRVLEAVKHLKYHPNLHARNLAAGRSRIWGMVVSDIENPFFPELIRAFEKRARQRGYEVIVSDTNYDPRLMKRAAVRMLEQKVGGVAIMTSEMSPRLIEEIVGRHIAVSLFDRGLTGPYMCDIKMDYGSGIRQAIEHLYGLGHRQIAFVAGRSSLKNVKARQVAYTQLMQAHGLEAGPVLAGNQRFEGGFAAGKLLVGLSPRPTAVIAMNDLTAVGVIKALHQHGLGVPGDVSVVGFDNTQLARQFIPRLTTLDMHTEVLGRLAADSLYELTSAPERGGKEYTMAVELVVGESTGPAPRLTSLADLKDMTPAPQPLP